MKPPPPTEFQEQSALVEWLEFKRLKFTSIPNSTFVPKKDNAKFWGQLNRNKASGVRKGFPDLVVLTPNKLLFIEMKRTKGGQTSSEQKEWLESLKLYPCVEVTVAKGCEEAISFIQQYV